MNAKKLAKTLVEAAMKLVRSSGKRPIKDLKAVAFDVPHEDGLIYAVLVGHGTEHFSMVLLRGENALELFRDFFGRGDEQVLQRSNVSFLFFSMERMKDLLPGFRRFLQRADHPPSRLAPAFLAARPGEEKRPANREECETLLAVISTLQAEGLAEQLEGSFDLGILSCVHVEGDVGRLECRVDYLDVETGEIVGREELLAHPGYVDPMALPADDDRAAWKAADIALAEKIAETCARTALANTKVLRQYLGELRMKDLSPAWRDECLMSYTVWYATWFRARENAPTALETMLEQSVRPSECALLDARLSGRVSLFEFLAPLSERSFEARDLLTGEKIDIDDGSLATSGRPGMGFILCLYAVGDFRFVTHMGTWFVVERGIDILEALDDLGVRSAEDLAAAPHLVGHLWAIANELRGPCMPRLQNTDGDPLVWHKADYRISDQAALEAWLEQAPDLEFDEHNGHWIWLRAKDETVLGHLQLIDDHVLAEVNSEARCDELQARLEAVPGICLESVTTQDIQADSLDDLPMDDRMGPSEELDLPDLPELRAKMQEFVNKSCMDWLEESIPMLDGKSPRETCATERGRTQVRHLILTYPNPSGIPGIAVPRAAMLAALDLPPQTE